MKRIFFVTTLFVAILACQNKKGGNQESQSNEKNSGPNYEVQIEKQRIPVQTKTIAKRAIQNNYQSTAILEAQQDIEILLSLGDTVKEVFFQTGDLIKKGDVIAKLESAKLTFDYKKAKINFTEAQRLHNASKKLYSNNHIAFDAFEESRIKLEQSQIALKEAEESLRQMSVKAPFDGIIAYNDLQIGASRSSYNKRAPIRVVKDTTLKGTFALPLAYKQDIQMHMQVDLFGRGIGKNATVTRISPVADINTGTILIYFEVANNNHKFLAGERITIKVPLGDSQEKLVLPENSVVFEGNTPYVFIPDNATKNEIDTELAKLTQNSTTKEGEDQKNSNTALAKDNKDEKKPEPSSKNTELVELIKKVPRARKIPVNIQQLASGEYALTRDQPKPAKVLKDGSEIIVVGIYQLADAAKLKILERF
ncbi:MAG: efflux RND transporter periplasmic adaptor subunit [Bdellovibrionota bacterium]